MSVRPLPVILGAMAGFALFVTFGLFHTRYAGAASITGYPFVWRARGTGFFGPLNWFNLALDIALWIGASILVLELMFKGWHSPRKSETLL